jgi:hypothetical protein
LGNYTQKIGKETHTNLLGKVRKVYKGNNEIDHLGEEQIVQLIAIVHL